MLEQEYLRRILKAHVYDVAKETPLQKAKLLSERIGNNVMLKREDLQSVFSFKLRGAYNKMANLTPEERAKGVIAAKRQATTLRALRSPQANSSAERSL